MQCNESAKLKRRMENLDVWQNVYACNMICPQYFLESVSRIPTCWVSKSFCYAFTQTKSTLVQSEKKKTFTSRKLSENIQ